MAESKCLYCLMGVCCLIAAVSGTNIRFSRKNVLSLSDLKNAGNTWYAMAYATASPMNDVLFNFKNDFIWPSSSQLVIQFKCQGYSPRTCLSSISIPTFTAIDDKAAFLDGDGGEYYAFVSSDPSQYLLLFWCWDGATFPESRECPADYTEVFIFVKNNRPDSFPMMSVVNDLKRNTDGVLGLDNEVATSGSNPLKFLYVMPDQYSCN